MAKASLREQNENENQHGEDEKVTPEQPKAPEQPAVNWTKYDALDNLSQKIRAMAADGYKRGQIARLLTDHLGRQENPIRYQHVRNVLISPLKKPVTSPSDAAPQTVLQD